ncbi:hypothetical protein BH24ACT15_BH24ACT15_31250 [soil metagenome]
MTYADAITAALERIISLAAGRSVKDLTENRVLLRAIERYWVLAGNAAKAQAAGIDVGMEPWSSLAGIRDALAHHRIDEVDPELLHRASTVEINEVVSAVRSAI